MRLNDAVRLNPEIESKEHNSVRTQISEYSNAIHNKGECSWFLTSGVPEPQVHELLRCSTHSTTSPAPPIRRLTDCHSFRGTYKVSAFNHDDVISKHSQTRNCSYPWPINQIRYPAPHKATSRLHLTLPYHLESTPPSWARHLPSLTKTDLKK